MDEQITALDSALGTLWDRMTEHGLPANLGYRVDSLRNALPLIGVHLRAAEARKETADD